MAIRAKNTGMARITGLRLSNDVIFYKVNHFKLYLQADEGLIIGIFAA